MRPSTLFVITAFLLTAACSDPQCQPDELRVGTLCRPVHAQPDAATDAPNARENTDGSAALGAADATASQDGSSAAGADGGAGARASDDADALLETLPGGPPAF
ncbi:MAG TPA: hypothetical protein VI299_21930, partial [Polyangiales bacterium]